MLSGRISLTDGRHDLQAHDFEAYQELLLSEPGATGPGAGVGAEERYEAVSKFLADTEEYIHKLAGKVKHSREWC